MRSQSWIVLGFGMALVAACGGGVSLGDLGSGTNPGPTADGGGGGGADGRAEGGTTECASVAECGPAPGAAAISCSDGSIGGNTGRCIKSGSGCSWEMRECPSDVCFDTAGTLDPTLKKCAQPSDCVTVTYQRDCCGTQRAAGVARTNESKVKQCAAARAAALPDCDCKTDPTTADDGSTDPGGGAPPSVTCNPSGQCETSFGGPVCGTAKCTANQICCSGVPFPAPTCIDNTGGCPISQRKHKKDITYLSEADRERLKDELLGFPLATYRYKSEGPDDREHLGFIIDDVAPSPAVLQSGERVDMYGYQTMAVAALQVQARELAALRREVEELKAACKADKGTPAKKR